MAGREGVDHEANVPAQQPQAKEDPWLPRPHEDAAGPTGARPSTCQGAQAPRGVMPAAAASGFRPEDRLRHRREFLRVYQEGRRIGGRCFGLFYLAGASDRHRLGLTVPRHVGGAVVRNRVKRRLREIFRLNREILGENPMDLVINVYPPGGKAPSAELLDEFRRSAREARQGRGRPGRKLGPRRGGRPSTRSGQAPSAGSGQGRVRSTGGGRR
jgi:ribonuclease P protein component